MHTNVCNVLKVFHIFLIGLFEFFFTKETSWEKRYSQKLVGRTIELFVMESK